MPSSVSTRTNSQFFQALPTRYVRTAVIFTASSYRRGFTFCDVGRQAVEQGIGPRPRRAVAPADSAMASRLDAKRQAEDLDEADGRSVIEGVALVVCGKAPVVER